MKDFKIVSAKTVLPVNAAAPVRGLNPPTLAVRGKQLNLATEVYYNDVRVDEFVILSADRMLVKIPVDQVGRMLVSIKILSESMLTRTDALLELAIPKPFTLVEGLERLVQTFVMVFLTTPGSDIFEPDSGGGARAIIGKNTNRQGQSVAADLVLALDRTKSEILRFQSSQPGLPLSEKLLSLDLESLSFVAEEGALNARVSLSNMLGEQADVSVG